jgi:osmoprotectant transport system substrate-binding protein
MKKIVLSCITLFLIIVLAACSSSSSGKGGKITIGGKDFTEQHVLSEMTAIYLKNKGYDVESSSNMGSTVVRQALENKQIDMYWEYTGTALIVYQKQDVETDPDTAYQKVKEVDEKNGITWLDKADFNNTYAIMMRKDTSEETGIKTISDLAEYVKSNPSDFTFSSNAEFYAREDGMKGLEKHYGFEFPSDKVVKMDSGLLYNALKDGEVDVSVSFATDARIKAFDLVLLDDDKQFFPAYNGAPVVRQEVLDNNPELADLLNELAAKLDNDTMIALNYAVDVEHKDVKEVCTDWLKEQGLID